MRCTLHSTKLVAALVAATSAAAQQPFDLDASFQVNLVNEYITSLILDDADGLLISGRLTFTDLESQRRNGRLNLEGVRDAVYYTSALGGGKLTKWMNGKAYVATDQTVRRLNADGTQDQSFIEMNLGPYFSSLQGGDYHVFPDGRVLMTGTHQLNDPVRGYVGYYRLIWFSNEGYLDTTRVHRQANGSIRRIRELADGRFLCYTTGNNYEGMSVNHLFRIQPDGAPDPTFTTTLGVIPTTSGNFRATYDIEPLPDGRILIGGFYGLSGTTDTLGVIKLLPDGELDVSFDPVPLSTVNGPSPWEFPVVFDILPLPDGRMIITGNFDHVRGVPRGGIAMLNADGTLSDDYFTGPGCGDYTGIEVNYRYISGIVPAPNGECYIHGAYMGYDDGSNSYPQQGFVSRLHGLNVGMAEWERIPFTLYPNPASTQLTVELEHMPLQGEWVLRDALGRVALRERVTTHQHTLGLHGLGSGMYLMELWSKGQRVGCERVVVE